MLLYNNSRIDSFNMAPRSEFRYSSYHYDFSSFDNKRHSRNKSDGSKRESNKSSHFDPYKILGVPKDASSNAVKIAYRRLALKHHPDKVNVSPEQSSEQLEEARNRASSIFAEIAAAYEILSDPQKRKRHDHLAKYGPTPESDDVSHSNRHDRDACGGNPTSGGARNTEFDDDNASMGSEKDMASSGLNFNFSTSRTQASDVPGGGRKFVTTTTQYINGRKSTREETLYSDGRREVRINTNPNSQFQGNCNDGIRVQPATPEVSEQLSRTEQIWEEIKNSVLCLCSK